MAVRMTTLVLVGVCLAGTSAVAQGLHHGHDHGGGNPWDAPDARSGGTMPYAPAGPGAFPPGMYDPTAVVPAGGMMPPPGMMPGGPMPTGGMMPPHMMHPGAMPPGMMPMPGHPGMAPVCQGDCPDGACPTGDCSKKSRFGWMDAAWSLDDRIVSNLKRNLEGGSIRFEWLNYEIEDPGNVLLGEQPTAVSDPTRPFNAFDLASPPNLVGVATVPTTGSIFLRDINGGRIVYAQPVALGDFEAAFWVTEQATDQFITLPLPLNDNGQQQFLSNSTLLNGNPSNNFQFYDDTYDLEYTSELWGAGARVLMEGSQGRILRLRPSIGWRYFAIQESLVQNATFRQTNLFNPAVSGTQFSNLRSEVFNNVMGVEFGVQAEAKFWIFAIGVDPAITLGPNISKMRTTTNNFVSTADPLRIREDNGYDFSPVLELGAYARVQLHEHVEFRAGYDAMWFLRVHRPARSITYDVNGANNTSLVRPKDELEEMAVDGLSLSLIFHFPVDCDVSDGWRR